MATEVSAPTVTGGLYIRVIPRNEVTGGTTVTHSYLMGGWVGGAPVQWYCSGTPDWTGASYPPGPPAPTLIKIVSQLT